MKNQPVPTTFPRRLMLVIHSLEGGGSERQMACLANHLAERTEAETVSLVTLSSKGSDRYQISDRIQRIGLDLTSSSQGVVRGLFSNLSRARALRHIAREIRPDVVISFCDMTNILTLYALGRRYPVLISERSDPRFQVLGRHWEWLRRCVYPRARVCVAQSDDVGDYLRQAVFRSQSGTQLVTIPSAVVVPERVAQRSSPMQNRPVKTLLYVGRLSAEKQVDKIIESWGKIHRQVPDWKLRIVGSGSLESSLHQLATQLQLADRIEWKSWTSDIWAEYEAANAFVMASRYEGFPQTLVEAISAGLPGVVVDCSPAIRTCIVHEESALIAPSVSELTPLILRLLSDEALRERLGTKARESSVRFRWEVIAPAWEDAIAHSHGGTGLA